MKVTNDNPNWFKQMKGDISKAVEAEVNMSTQKIANQARRDAPVDDGFLKNSINAETRGLSGLIEATANYAPYVEFGTGGLVDVPAGMEDYAIQFKGKGIKKVNLQPKPFLMPNYMKEGKNFKKKLKRITDGNF